MLHPGLCKPAESTCPPLCPSFPQPDVPGHSARACFGGLVVGPLHHGLQGGAVAPPALSEVGQTLGDGWARDGGVAAAAACRWRGWGR